MKFILVSSLISLFVLSGLIIYIASKYDEIVPEIIMNSVVIVENSSGIVVYQNDEFILVLTAAHVVENIERPALVKIFTVGEDGTVGLSEYVVEDYAIDK